MARDEHLALRCKCVLMKPELSVKITGPTDLFSHSEALKGQTISEDTPMEKDNVDEVIMGKPLSVGVCSCLRLGLIYPTTGGKVHRDEGWKHSDTSGNWQWYCGRPGHCGLGYLEGNMIRDILVSWRQTYLNPFPRRLADLVTCAVYGWRDFAPDKGPPTGVWRANMPSVLSSGPAGAPAEKILRVPVPFLTSNLFSRKDWEEQFGHLSVSSESAMIMSHELQNIAPRLSYLIGSESLVSAKKAQSQLAETLGRLSFSAEVACEAMAKVADALKGTEPPFDTADLGTAVSASEKTDEAVPSLSFKDLLEVQSLVFKDGIKSEQIIKPEQNVFIGYEAGQVMESGEVTYVTAGTHNVHYTLGQSEDGAVVGGAEISQSAESAKTEKLFILPESLIMLKDVLETLDLTPVEAVEILMEHHRNSVMIGTREPKRREEEREAEWDAIEI